MQAGVGGKDGARRGGRAAARAPGLKCGLYAGWGSKPGGVGCQMPGPGGVQPATPQEALAEMMRLTRQAEVNLSAAYHPDGLNIGMNLERPPVYTRASGPSL